MRGRGKERRQEKMGEEKNDGGKTRDGEALHLPKKRKRKRETGRVREAEKREKKGQDKE